MSRQKHQGDAEDRATPFSIRDLSKDVGRGHGRGASEGGGPRTERLQHLMFEEVDRLFRLEINDRRLQQVRPVALLLSPDLRNAKVMYGLGQAATGVRKSSAAEAKQDREVSEGLLRVTPFLRARVAEALSMKRVPDLHFHRDRDAEAALRAAELLAREQAKAAPAPVAGAKEDAAGPDPAPSEGDTKS